MTLHTLAKEKGIYFRKLMTMLDDGAIEPSFDPKSVHATFYERTLTSAAMKRPSQFAMWRGIAQLPTTSLWLIVAGRRSIGVRPECSISASNMGRLYSQQWPPAAYWQLRGPHCSGSPAIRWRALRYSVSPRAPRGVSWSSSCSCQPDQPRLAGAGAGATLTLAALLLIGSRSTGGPERSLLIGICLATLGSAIDTVLLSTGHPALRGLLGWLSGSTAGVEPFAAIMALSALIGALVILPALLRWLAILPLGQAAAGAVGVPVGSARTIVLAYCAVLNQRRAALMFCAVRLR